MKRVVYLIRHGATAGNLEKKYIGSTDEPLCAAGRAQLARKKALPRPDALFVSPMLRCVQTAKILYPQMRPIVVPDFRECDFGAFENKNYRGLSRDPAYQAWVDSNGELPFPGGESRGEFQMRCARAFRKVCARAEENSWESFACVVHGGTIMSILSEFAVPERGYYEYQTGNGCGYAALLKRRGQNTPEHMVDFELSVWYAF